MSPRITRSTRRRLFGVDAARGLALIGMMVVHVLPTTDPSTGEATWAGLAFAGKSAALFAVLAGVGLALLSAGADARLVWSRKVIAVRAVLIILIGLGIAALDHGVAVILVNYGVLFLLALPFLRLGARALFALAGAWVLAAPALYWWLHNTLRESVERFPSDWRLWHSPGVEDVLTPGLLGTDLALTGYYPLLLWPAYLFAGMALGRLDLKRTTTAMRLAGLGLIGAVLTSIVGRLTMWLSDVRFHMMSTSGWTEEAVLGELQTGTHHLPLITDPVWFLLITPHQGSTLDLLHTLSVAVAVLGFCLLLASLLKGPLKWPLAPLADAGAMPLTLYVGHLVVLHYWRPEGAPLHDVDPATLVWIFLLSFLVLGLVKSMLGRRGPLEALTHAAGVAVAGPAPGR
ncbi:heparan-alpha-glucosaminide N-acetyltransferase domain-containing protein [Nesterenkonia flava]|uniref:Heparan-alpha-glucosaminide N-acetyltransferase domain-containing protein n=1 Tax=Nesterenkonia flava TaxID=469799 RepID=A0ABU1FSH3_9MICC|nr:heparan-alpha-glucosaminide N-acetyltransferase domain-containing protein [Nesterenkonia flava]MDR5711609.1 heparan-alpha-glucosaminide N-acetyltransferase domain-containing protein [Nesterenkonia flava]